jgi:hypothetical protein
LLKKQVYILQRDQVNVVLSLQALGKDPVEDIKPLNLESPKNANWEPVKMRLTERMVTVTIPASDITLAVPVPVQENASPSLFKMVKATLGGNYDTQDSTVDILSTFEVFMSESRIWKSTTDGETSLADLEFPNNAHIFKRHDPSNYALVDGKPLNNNNDGPRSGLEFMWPPTPLRIEERQDIPDLNSEKIFIWRKDSIPDLDPEKDSTVDKAVKPVLEIDSSGEIRRRDVDFLNIQSNIYPSMYLVSKPDSKKKFGKVVLKREQTDLPMGLTKNFFSSDPQSLGLRGLKSLRGTFEKIDPEREILLESETDKITKAEQIDITKSFLMSVGNTQDGWLLDTSDERFLILPTEPGIILGPDDNQTMQKQFECIRLGSKRVSEILLKQNIGIKSLYNPDTQETRESKTGLTTPKKSIMRLPEMSSPIDFFGPNGIYYREIFYEIPLHLATNFNAAGDYQSAQDWMHYVFNPQKNNAWIYRPFRDLRKNPIASRVSDPVAISVLKDNMLDPHAIADTRMVAHMKAFMFRYIDNLLDWGDSLFAQDTREAINESLILYFRCLAILGERPYSIPADKIFEMKIKSVGEILSPENNKDSFTRAFFLPGWKNRPVVRKYDSRTNKVRLNGVSLENPAVLGQFFQVPENKQLMTYWDRVDDRLDKIRRSLNISGIFRQLPLFQPPIDPRALIAAGGASGLQVPLPIPNYRFSLLLSSAKEMIEMTMAFGAQLQAAMESGSAEQLAMQELKMSLALSTVNKRIKNNAIAVAEQEKEQLRISERIVVDKLNRVKAKLGEATNSDDATKYAAKYKELQNQLKVNAATSNRDLICK